MNRPDCCSNDLGSPHNFTVPRSNLLSMEMLQETSGIQHEEVGVDCEDIYSSCDMTHL